MKPPQEPSPSQMDLQLEFENTLADAESSLVALRQRYMQVQHDWKRQAELQQRLHEVKKQQRKNPLPELKAELKKIQEQLEAIEVNLESQLFTWGSVKEPFWQAIRFGGLGIVVGWILKSFAR